MEIYVYGTGCGAGELTREALEPTRIAAFAETEPTRETFLGRPVIPVSALAERQVDLLIVTAKDAPEFPLPAEKVLYLKNHLALRDRNRAYTAARKALGDAFVDFFEETARKAGCICLRLDTGAFNPVSRPLYKKHGFREVGIVPITYLGIPGVELVLFEKML